MALEGVREWLDQADAWRRRVGRELAVLPDTLAQFREGVENFQKVSRRLAEATEAMEQINLIQSGALKAVKEQLSSAPGGTVVAGAIDDLADALGTMARLNPFWPRPGAPSRPSRRPGDAG